MDQQLADLALSGKSQGPKGEDTSMDLNVELFTKGLVATLIDSGLQSVRPHSPNDQVGFQRIVDFLNTEIERSRQAIDPQSVAWYRQLVRVRNKLQPSNNGAFDNFETALRDLQYSFTGCPNAFYEEIQFEVSRPFALSYLADLPDRYRVLVSRAGQAFLSTNRAHSHS